MSKDEIKTYCRYATARYGNGKPIYRLGYGLVLILSTGLRFGEALGLKWEDIDFERKTLKVQRTPEHVKKRNKADGGNSYILIEGTTKSKSSERTIPQSI